MLKLEVFETSERPSASSTVVLDTLALEEAKLASYDAGYSAGWEDASGSQEDEQSRIKSDLAHNLQTLGFTYHEARMHVLKAIEPLLRDVVGSLLPVVARESLAALVLELLMPLAATLADAPITVVLNPVARRSVESLMESETGLPLTIVEEPTLGEGQVYLRFNSSEMHVDLDRAIAEIASAVRGFFDHPQKETVHG